MTKTLAPATLLQLRISLKYSNPAIWRVVLVPDSITLVQLHQVIQEAMGWWSGHLHEFDIAGRRYGMIDPEWDEDPELLNEARKSLLKVLGGKKKFLYLYDFGDSWLHEITLEAQLPMIKAQRYATCLMGENACPPEDVGGLPGYYEFLEVIADTENEEHEDMLEWCGGSFDPKAFDVDAINEQLKRIKL
jgi:hypothetical protein